MSLDLCKSKYNVFRSNAWVSSWVEVWGANPRIKLIDLGGNARPLELAYSFRHKLKGVIPIKSLVIAGYGYADFNPPRAEYNSFDAFIDAMGSIESCAKAFKRLAWNQFVLTDFTTSEITEEFISRFSAALSCRVVTTKSDAAYRVNASDFSSYKRQLSASTRAKYFNRRAKLAEYGQLDFVDTADIECFFETLNQFHMLRWARPCYSLDSMHFFKLFIARLQQDGGKVFLQFMRIDGEVVSALFDIEWNGVRYNLQSGYFEQRFSQVALGSIHLGFAIEYAIKNGLVYDLLAGEGKRSDYKAKIATERVQMITQVFARGWLQKLYSIYGK